MATFNRSSINPFSVFLFNETVITLIHRINILMAGLINAARCSVCLLFFNLFFHFSGSLILIKVSELNTNDVSLQKHSGEKPFDPLLSWRVTFVLDYLHPCRGGFSLPGSRRSLCPVVHRCPAGLPGNVSSDGHTSPAVGGVLWRLRQLCSRLAGRSDSPVRCSVTFLCLC